MSHVTRRSALAGFFVAIAPAAAFAQAKRSEADRVIHMFDPDKDGTLDLDEVKAAASALFDKLDRDKDGRLSIRELQGRLSRGEFQAANPDNDGTLDKQEFLAVVEQRFKAANPDADGTVDRKELASKAGRALMRLMH